MMQTVNVLSIQIDPHVVGFLAIANKGLSQMRKCQLGYVLSFISADEILPHVSEWLLCHLHRPANRACIQSIGPGGQAATQASTVSFQYLFTCRLARGYAFRHHQ